MHKEILQLVESFIKRDLSRLSEGIEAKDERALDEVKKWLLETGIGMAPLPQDAGGAGLSDETLVEVLMLLASESASFAFSLLAHWCASIAVEMSGGKIEADEFFLFPLPGRRLLAGFPFFTAGVELKGEVVKVEAEKVRERGEVHLLGLNGVSFFVEGESWQKSTGDVYSQNLTGRFFNLTASIAWGNAESAWKHAVNYAEERYQGGDVLIKHNIIKNMLGEAKAKIFASGCAVRESARSHDLSHKLASCALACRFGEEVCSEALQVFGGYGYMRDYPVERRYRDAKTLSALTGGWTWFTLKIMEVEG